MMADISALGPPGRSPKSEQNEFPRVLYEILL